MADRKGDIHEWLLHAERIPLEMRASCIIRAKVNRTLEPDDDEPMLLWICMDAADAKEDCKFAVPMSETQSVRTADIAVKAE